MPADGMSAAAEKTGFRRPPRQLVDKTTPAAPGLKGAHDVSSCPDFRLNRGGCSYAGQRD